MREREKERETERGNEYLLGLDNKWERVNMKNKKHSENADTSTSDL